MRTTRISATTMKIEINVEKKGTLKGSCGWVTKRLATAKVVIRDNALYVTYEDGKNVLGKTLYVEKAICGIIDDIDFSVYARTNQRMWYAYTYDEDFGESYDKYCLFECILTPAANIIAEDFIQECLKAFTEAWDNDKEEE